MKTTKKLKTITLSLGLAAAMLPVANVSAQGVFGDMLDNYYDELDRGNERSMLMRDGGSGSSFSISTGISTGQFGGNGGQAGGNYGISIGLLGSEPPAPLGSGLFIMAAAGAAYAFSKKRKNKK